MSIAALITAAILSLAQEVGPVRCTITASEEPAPQGAVLWYEQPASEWTQALPVGNGRVGAMVFGGVGKERIGLNEDSIWRGRQGKRPTPQSAASLERIRQLFFDGRIEEAQAMAARELLCDSSNDPYQTLGELNIESPLSIDATEYRRGLDLGTGVTATAWIDRGFRVLRTVFASMATNALVIRQETEEPRGLFLRISFDRKPSCDGCALSIDCEADGSSGAIHVRGATEAAQGDGVKYAADILIRSQGGSVRTEKGTIVVRAADGVDIIVVAATDFPFVGAGRGEALSALRSGAPVTRPDPQGLIAQVAAALPESSRVMQSDHERVWREQFDRFDIELGPEDAAGASLPTDERLKRIAGGANDPGLVALIVQYARALLMSSSVRGGLPANLQGIWCDSLTPPWDADFHININLQMNYWPAEVLNVAPCVDPLVDFVDRLAVDGARTAREMYGARGWMAHHTTDAWCWTVPAGRHTVWALWPHGGGWMTQPIHDHWDYSRDEAFLRQRAFPLLRGAAEFYLDYLVEDPQSHLLVSGPSSSPENSFTLPGGQRADSGMGNTMDQMIIHDVLTNLLEEAQALGDSVSGDPVVVRARHALARLKPPVIGADGRILEWSDAWDEPEPGHRHVSHVFGLHPGHQLTAQETPELLAAARKSLDYRLAHGGGHTGWSRAWLINLFARLKDGEEAWRNVQALLAKSTLPNLFDNHPPFQIDGNFGSAAGVAEMLVQSHREVGAGTAARGHVIELLPALPKEWSSGSVRGLRARGGVTLDLVWEEGRIAFASIKSSGDEPLRIAWPEGVALPIVERGDSREEVGVSRTSEGWMEVAPRGAPGEFRFARSSE